MSALLELAPFGPRDDAALVRELQGLTEHHLRGCEPYRRIHGEFHGARTLHELPFLHVGLFKRMQLRTDAPGIVHERTLTSSSTTGASPSQVPLDKRSSELQARSARSILTDFLGPAPRTLLVLDCSQSLRTRGTLGARVAAAMSLRPLANDLQFLLGDAQDPASVRWDKVEAVLERDRSALVYGFTWMLWKAWAAGAPPPAVRALLQRSSVAFVHSGGWKKLQAMAVEPAVFDRRLLECCGPGSLVLDFYGLVEQVGVVFPACAHGARHVPAWAGAIVRSPETLEPLEDRPGMLQLLNPLAWGGPYHSVLTEDLARMLPGPCACGRSGPRFELLGRIPRAELRGCANV